MILTATWTLKHTAKSLFKRFALPLLLVGLIKFTRQYDLRRRFPRAGSLGEFPPCSLVASKGGISPTTVSYEQIKHRLRKNQLTLSDPSKYSLQRAIGILLPSKYLHLVSRRNLCFCHVFIRDTKCHSNTERKKMDKRKYFRIKKQ